MPRPTPLQTLTHAGTIYDVSILVPLQPLMTNDEAEEEEEAITEDDPRTAPVGHDFCLRRSLTNANKNFLYSDLFLDTEYNCVHQFVKTRCSEVMCTAETYKCYCQAKI